MENYVKFLRGTPAAFEKLAAKDNNTLYFISEPGAKNGLLYLGEKLIAGGTSGDISNLSLGDLKDIVVDWSKVRPLKPVVDWSKARPLPPVTDKTDEKDLILIERY